MEPLKTETVRTYLTAAVFAQLVAYARANRWSLSTALAVLAEHGLNPGEPDTTPLR